MAQTRWLTADQQDAWVRFAAVLELLPAALNSQLERDEQLSHFEYFVLAMLSEAHDRRLRMTALASRTNSTIARLSRVVSRLEAQGFVARVPSDDDGRVINAVLTDLGWQKIVHAAPGHVENVRHNVVDALTAQQVEQLRTISTLLLERLDPKGAMLASVRPSTTRSNGKRGD
jgi:DNA-binding MarR family transcriptional regulator